MQSTLGLFLTYDHFATVHDDDALLHISIDAAAAKVEDTLGAVTVDGADDGLNGVRVTTLARVVVAAEHRGEAGGISTGIRGLEVGAERTDRWHRQFHLHR